MSNENWRRLGHYLIWIGAFTLLGVLFILFCIPVTQLATGVSMTLWAWISAGQWTLVAPMAKFLIAFVVVPLALTGGIVGLSRDKRP